VTLGISFQGRRQAPFETGQVSTSFYRIDIIDIRKPQFEGQTKTKLGNTEVGTAVSQAVSTVLENYLEENPREASSPV